VKLWAVAESRVNFCPNGQNIRAGVGGFKASKASAIAYSLCYASLLFLLFTFYIYFA
jgi:hypothetical protein